MMWLVRRWRGLVSGVGSIEYGVDFFRLVCFLCCSCGHSFGYGVRGKLDMRYDFSFFLWRVIASWTLLLLGVVHFQFSFTVT